MVCPPLDVVVDPAGVNELAKLLKASQKQLRLMTFLEQRIVEAHLTIGRCRALFTDAVEADAVLAGEMMLLRHHRVD